MKIGTARYSFPSMWAVFGDVTVIRPAARSTSRQRRSSTSDGHRSRSNRDRAMTVRHVGLAASVSGRASVGVR